MAVCRRTGSGFHAGHRSNRTGSTLVIVAERSQPVNGSAIVSYSVSVLPDTLPQPVVQRTVLIRKQLIPTEPAWPTDNNPTSEGRTIISLTPIFTKNRMAVIQ